VEKMKYIVFVSIVFFLAWLDPYKDAIDEGNNKYSNGNYTEADSLYDNAIDYLPSENERPYVEFNKGSAKYKAEDYEGAIDQFKRALNTDNEELQKFAFFNLGNAYYQKGEKELALESWMNALKIDPEYTKAQMNIEKLFLEEQKQDQEQQQNQQNENSENEDENENKQSQNQENQAQEGNENRPDHQKGQKIEQELSKEQIEAILQQFKARPLQKKGEESSGRGGRALEKDW
jgi:Ca-activated chloride channel family protein